jgi:hypothetical protein
MDLSASMMDKSETNMKILSLETKKHLVGWSVVLGLIIHRFVSVYFQSNICQNFLPSGNLAPNVIVEAPSYCVKIGWPISAYDGLGGFTWGLYILNVVVLVLGVLIILCLIRHFRKQNIGIPSKQS